MYRVAARGSINLRSITNPETIVQFEDGASEANIHFDRCAVAPKFENLPARIKTLDFYNCSAECVRDATRSIGSTEVVRFQVTVTADHMNRAWVENGYVLSDLPPVCRNVHIQLNEGSISGSIVVPSTLRKLHVHRLQTLASIPDMRHCKDLEVLSIAIVGGLRSIDGTKLPVGGNPLSISATHCPDLEEITGTSSMIVYNLTVGWCPNMRRIDFPSKIHQLYLRNVGISRLPDAFPSGMTWFTAEDMPNLTNMVLEWPEGTTWVKYIGCPNLSLTKGIVLPKSMKEFGVAGSPNIKEVEFYDMIRTRDASTVMRYNGVSDDTEKRFFALRDVPFFDRLGGSATGPWFRILKFLKG